MTDTGWKLSGELTPDVAERLDVTLELLADAKGIAPPTLSRFEQRDSDLWRVDIFFAERPAETFVEELLDKAGITRWAYEFAPIEDRDWVSESQKLLAPVRAGDFLVYGSHDADKTEASLINLQIDAGQAFGTGKHETTAACLELMSGLRQSKAPENALDLGTGSGVLALAAAKIWPDARITASDIDPIAVDVARENGAINAVPERQAASDAAGVAYLTADGLTDEPLKAEKPYDLIVANILAGPLIDMAADITGALAPHGALILSGLLISQRDDVLTAYRAQGLSLDSEAESGEWCALQLTR